MKKEICFIGVLLVIGAVLSGCSEQPSKEEYPELIAVKNWAYQLQNADPDVIAASGFELVVVDYSKDGSEERRYSSEEINRIKDSGIVPIAYISIGEAEDYRFYWQEGWRQNPPSWLGEENPEWEGNYAVKYWNEGWKDIILSYLDKIMEQGFSGVYLDKVDEFEYWSSPNNNGDVHLSEEEAARRMINLITDIANYCRGKSDSSFYIIPQNGERLINFDNSSLLDTISGWAVEDLFYDGTDPIPLNVTQVRTHYLDAVYAAGKPVFSVDYVDDGSGYSEGNKERIDDYYGKALNKGYIPYAAKSDRELDELNVIGGIQP